MTKAKKLSRLRPSLALVCKIHFILAFAYTVQLIAFHSSHLITPDIVLKRGLAVAILTIVSIVAWFFSRSNLARPGTERAWVWILIITDIAFAATNIYLQRGMASRAIILFGLPIITASLLRSKSALITASVLSAVVYMTTALAYFVLNFNEGYNIELYGETIFYAVFLLLQGRLLWALMRSKE